MNIAYTLIRSRRKTLSIQINNSGAVIARAPMKLSLETIEKFILSKGDWVQKHQEKGLNKTPKPIFGESEIQIEKEKLRTYIIPRIYELGVGKNLPKITSIKITKSERRWGSCSIRNGLCFSYRLSDYLDGDNEIFIDAIIIHEFAHLLEKNHQKPFWNLVKSWMPEYEAVMKNNTFRE